MEIHQLRYFVAVAQTGSFSRAADQCHVSQPSLSQQIAKLERHLGCKLFDRLPQGTALTDAGEVLLKQATAILSAVEETEQRLRDGNTQYSRLTVGAIPTIAPYLLPQTLEHFSQAHPETVLTVHEDVTEQLIQGLIAGEIDVALMALPIDNEQIATQALFSEPLLLALPARHKLAEQRPLHVSHLKDERFIVLNEMHCLGRQVLSFCHVNHYGSSISCRSAQIATVQELIKCGQGISILPRMALEYKRRSTSIQSTSPLIFRELCDAHLSRTVAVAWHRHRYMSLAMRNFIENISRHLADNGAGTELD